MTKMRYCVKCQSDKPAEGFVCLSRGKFGRTKVYVCEACHGRTKRIGSVTERDAYGKEVTARNKAELSAWRKHDPKRHLNEGALYE